ncbi:MAG: alpha/beta hydrolase [Gammaproteobacteria bacterium]
MYRQKILHLAALIFVILSCRPEALAQIIDEANYRYPYKDPFVATATVALMQGREAIPSGHIRDLEIKVLDGRDNIDLLEGKGTLRYRFYQQKGAAPLIYIIPGLGSSAYAGSARYLAEFLAGHGFHVLIIPSPFSWNFTLAASRSGVPGSTREDAQDLYAVMQLTLNAVKRRWRAKIGKVGLLGLSEGALEASHIGELDAAQRQIGIDAYLLVNPPVNLLKGVRQIDAMAALGERYGDKQREYLEAYALGVVAGAIRGDPDEPDYFADWDSRTELTERQFKYLIGNEMQKAVGDVIYTSDLAFDLGILKTPVSWGFRSARLNEARSYTLMGYVKVFLIPRLRQLNDKRITVEQLDDRSSLKVVKTTLENNKRIFLMHNLDDFLLSDEDYTFLDNVFGHRAKFYPRGGHLGNLWFADNKKNILDIFKPLLLESQPFPSRQQ